MCLTSPPPHTLSDTFYFCNILFINFLNIFLHLFSHYSLKNTHYVSHDFFIFMLFFICDFLTRLCSRAISRSFGCRVQFMGPEIKSLFFFLQALAPVWLVTCVRRDREKERKRRLRFTLDWTHIFTVGCSLLFSDLLLFLSVSFCTFLFFMSQRFIKDPWASFL